MATELVELGLEGIDFVADKYHDTIYEGLGRTGHWVSTRRERLRNHSRKRSTSQEKAATPAAPASPASPTSPTPRKMQSGENNRSERQRSKRYSRDRDEYYSDEDRGRRNSWREKDRDSSYYGERERVEEWRRTSQGHQSPPPQIKVDDINDDSHIYPPPPKPMQPPYPTAGQLIPMPPDAPYPLQRSRSDNRPDQRSRSLIPRDDYDTRGRGLITRSRSANYGRARSRSRSHERSLDRGYRRRSGRVERDIDNPHHNSRHFNHVTAGIAGALAGGYLGREVSKGDMAATVAGALVGALGAGVAEREWERYKGKHRREDEKWEMSYGRR